MKGIKKVIASPIFTTVAFLLAAALVILSGISGARAALKYTSEYYKAEVNIKDTGVALLENGNVVSYRTYKGEGVADSTALENVESKNWDVSTGLADGEGGVYDPLLARFASDYSGDDKEEFKLGQKYDEVLTVKNTGTINEYVRVNIYRYWLDANGDKMRDLDPSQIVLDYSDYLGSDWVEDTDAATDERVVLYYTKLLKCESNLSDGESSVTSAFNGSFSVDPDIGYKVTQTRTTDDDGNVTITTVYNYDGSQFCIEATVDAVQEHHAEDAIWSAWGREVSIADDGTLSLK